MEQQNCVEEITKSEKQLSGSVILKGVKNSGQNFKETRRGLNQQKHKVTLKPAMISGQSKATSFIVITSNLEFSSTCRKKNHSQHH